MRTWIKRHKTNLLLTVVFLVGLTLLLYPTFSDWWNSFHQSRAVMSYAEAVGNMNQEDYDRILKRAKKYNKKLAKSGTLWTLTKEQKKDYESQLAIDGTDVIAYIDIPKINVTLPIYHGTNEAVLQVAVGHLEGTSLPIGGKSTHCVVSGHRGLPSARLFTDIDKLVVGDTWTINVLDKTITYEVDQIRIVEPTDLSNLQIEPGKDYCTLVTCTPYGINSHRLLVRGHRVPNKQNDLRLTADAMQIEPSYVAPIIAVPILIALLIWLLITNRRKKK